MTTASGADAETVVVMGGGIAGLGIALALRESRFRVVIIERDQAPADFDPALAFEQWKRPGVVQFRHPHVFFGRLQRLLNDRHPELLAELLNAGFWRLPISEYGNFRTEYQPAPGDEDLTQFCGRRATFEYVLQRYVRRLSNVRIIDGARVEGITLSGQGPSTQVRSVEIERGQDRESITGDVFVDCLGRRSPVLGWLRDHGRSGKQESHNSQTWYFSRHYRLHDGARPQLDEQSGDLDFLRYAIVYGENGHFAIGLSVDESDMQLTQMVRRPDGFERVCRTIPQVRDWVTNAQPVTKVLGFGDIENKWVEPTQRGRPLALGLLHAGDSARETNPFYGKGCTAALVSAHLVAEVLHHTRDADERGRRFAAHMRSELRPYYDFSVATDRMFRARSLATRGSPVPLAQRLVGHAYLTLVVPAAFEDAQVARTLLGVQHMRSPTGLRAQLALVVRILYLALRRLPRRIKAPKLVLPQRSEFMAPLPESHATAATSSTEAELS